MFCSTSPGLRRTRRRGRLGPLVWEQIRLWRSDPVRFPRSPWYESHLISIYPCPCLMRLVLVAAIQYLLANLGMSTNFGTVDLEHLTFVSTNSNSNMTGAYWVLICLFQFFSLRPCVSTISVYTSTPTRSTSAAIPPTSRRQRTSTSA